MEKYLEVYHAIRNKQKECFVGSITEDGYPKIRAMLLPVMQEDNVFWFHTNTSSQKVRQFKDDPKACIYFCDPASFTGLGLLGTMEVLEDQITKDAFWQDGYELYYGRGAADPDFCVLKFTASEGELYGNFSVTKLSV